MLSLPCLDPGTAAVSMHVTGAQTCDTVSAKWPENESKVIRPPLTGEYPLLSHDTVVSSSTRILLTGAD